MLSFFIFSILFMLAGNFILRIFFEMIQPGEALDKVFGWQKMLGRLYAKGDYAQLIGKALGDCERCTSFWFMPLWFIAYYFMSVHVIHWWISDPVGPFWAKALVNITWYSVFHSVGATWGFFFLLKGRKK